MRAIETTATIDAQGHLCLDRPLPGLGSEPVRIIVLVPEDTEQNFPNTPSHTATALNDELLDHKNANDQSDNVPAEALLKTLKQSLQKVTGQDVLLVDLWHEFTAWQETLYLLSNPANAAHILSSIESAEVGQVMEKSLIEESSEINIC
jgi:antitoxin YefM